MSSVLVSAFLLALREIRRNLMRSFLTVLGIVIGVAAVVTMVTLGNGATRAKGCDNNLPLCGAQAACGSGNLFIR